MKKGLSICLVISMLSTTSLTAMAQDVSKLHRYRTSILFQKRK